ncbi:hypothetical protein J4Q44_G00037750, partial [Coregonus suidteri]
MYCIRIVNMYCIRIVNMYCIRIVSMYCIRIVNMYCDVIGIYLLYLHTHCECVRENGSENLAFALVEMYCM